MQKDLKAEPHNQMKSASLVVPFGHIIIYIHAQHAKEDLTLRRLSSDSKLKGLQMPEKKEETCGGAPQQKQREQKIIKRDFTGGKEQQLPLKGNIQSTEQTWKGGMKRDMQEGSCI